MTTCGTRRIQRSYSLPQKLVVRLERLAALELRSRSGMVAYLLEKGLAAHRPSPAVGRPVDDHQPTIDRRAQE